MKEALISINGYTCTPAESATIRVALGSLLMDTLMDTFVEELYRHNIRSIQEKMYNET